MSTRWESIAQEMKAVFDRNFRERGELGASVSVWGREGEIMSLSDGYADRERTRPWTAETLVPVWSATKGPASLACMLALEKAGLPLEAKVCEVWPGFGQAGKKGMTFSQL